MTQRISDYELGYYQDARYYYARLIGDLVDDLVDSRAEVSRLQGEVERLKALSESQTEALDAIDRGVKF